MILGKRIIYFSFLIGSLAFSSLSGYAQSGNAVLASNQAQETMESEKNAVKEIIKKYLKAGDERNVEHLKASMHNSYRVVFNDTNEKVVKVIARDQYLDFIEKGIFGGIPREVDFIHVDVFNGINAIAKLTTTSDKAVLYEYFSLAKENGQWWIMQDLVFMEPK